MTKLLIAEDDPSISMLEQDYLELEGFEVTVVGNGQLAVTEALTGQYALILLDLMLPGCNGYDVCRMIRDKVDVPILMVTARTELVDKIRGLGLGADDYIAKPFDPAELVARVKAHLSRYARLTGTAHEEQEVITAGDVRIFPQSRRVFKGEQEIKMPNREFSLLQYLAEHPNMVFSKEKLFETIWGYDYVGDSATVTVHIGRVRDKIEDDPAHPRIIETVWGAGYRLNNAPGHGPGDTLSHKKREMGRTHLPFFLSTSASGKNTLPCPAHPGGPGYEPLLPQGVYRSFASHCPGGLSPPPGPTRPPGAAPE